MATKKQPVPTVPITAADVAQKIKAQFLEHAHKSATAQDAKDIVQAIVADLDKVKAEVTANLLGLSTKWGRPEIDHCNERMATIDVMVQQIAEPIIKDWIRDAVNEFMISPDAAKLRQQTVTAIHKDIKERVGWGLVTDASKQITATLVAQAAAEVRKECGLS